MEFEGPVGKTLSKPRNEREGIEGKPKRCEQKAEHTTMW